MMKFLDAYIKTFYWISRMKSNKCTSFVYPIAKIIGKFILKEKLASIIFNMNTIEELLYEYVCLADFAHFSKGVKPISLPINKDNESTFIYNVIKDPSRPNDGVIGTNCKLYSSDYDFCIWIHLRIMTEPCITKLTCSLGNNNKKMNVNSASELMRFKSDIIELLKIQIEENVWYIYNYLIDHTLDNIEVIEHKISTAE